MDRTYFRDCQQGSDAVADASIERCDLERSFLDPPDSAPAAPGMRALRNSWAKARAISLAEMSDVAGRLRRDLLRLKRSSTAAGYLASDSQIRLAHFDAAGRYSVEAANSGLGEVPHEADKS